MTPKEKMWRGRNPELAARFDRLPAGAKQNIRTNLFGTGTASLVRSADAVRREAVKARSAYRRKDAKARARAREFMSLTSRQRSQQRQDYLVDDALEQRLFWAEYDRGMGN